MSAVGLAGSALAAGAAFGALAWTIAAPTCGFWGRLRYRGDDGNQGEYALTFDDGPTRDSTAATLDILGELGVVATFFVIGVNAQRCPDLLARMHEQGHLVANHSMHHAHLGMFGRTSYWQREIGQTDGIIQQSIGVWPRLFRPPMGIKTPQLMRASAGSGHSVVTWSRRAVDGISTTPQRILGRLVPHTTAGDIVLLHDGVEPSSRRNQSATVAAIAPLVRQLRDRGLTPVSLERLLRIPAYADASALAAPLR